MERVTVPALTTFDYEGREYQRGDAVSMTPIDAAVHARLQHVSLLQGTVSARSAAVLETREMAPEPEPAPVRTKRAYRRRDLKAQP